MKTYHVNFVVPQSPVLLQILHCEVDTVVLLAACCSLTLTFDLRRCSSAAQVVPGRRSRWTWRDAGRPRPPRSPSTDPGRRSARQLGRDDPGSLIRRPACPSRPFSCPPAGGEPGFWAEPASWSRWYGTEPVERSSLRRRERPPLDRPSARSSPCVPAAVAAAGDDGSSSDDGSARSVVARSSALSETGCTGRSRRGTSVELGCSRSGYDIRRSRRSAVSRL